MEQPDYTYTFDDMSDQPERVRLAVSRGLFWRRETTDISTTTTEALKGD